MSMKYQVTKGNLPMANIELQPYEKIYADAGAMVYMTGNTVMQAKARGGAMKSLGRMLMQENLFLTEFTTTGGTGLVAVAGTVPGSIIAREISPQRTVLAQKSAFLAADDAVVLSLAFQQKLSAGLFGGEGFILQKFTGQGTVLLAACGEFVEMNLQPGQNVRVDTGCVVCWDESVKFEITKAGGIKTMLLGGEGLFLASLTGPGNVVLQSMNLKQLALALSPFLARSQ
jgi:uncharacterized protein (TIGR00266 family)